MKSRRDKYQQGSIRRVKRASGFAWEFRYTVEENGKRTAKSQYFDGALYRTEKAVRQKVESQLLKLNEDTEYARAKDVTFNALLDRYVAEEMPARHATKGSYTSIIKRRLRPQWGERIVSEIRPAELHAWFQSLDLAPLTKAHLRSLMHKLFDLATLWEYLPLERRNPIEIVKIKNVTRRTKEAVVLSPEQFREVIRRLPAHVNMITITMACLGLRISEALGLRWEDFDWHHTTVTIRRSAYRGAIDETKTTSSKAKLPLAHMLAELLLVWKTQSQSPWLFANPITEMPYMSPSLQQRWIRPAGEAIGIEGLGFHSLRHSYRSWLDATGAAPGVTKDLMRHSAIATTFNVYGKALSPEKREANNRVVELLLAADTVDAS
jgi:integrase